MKKREIARRWIKDHKYTLIYFLLYDAVLFVVYALYRFPIGIAGYTALLGGCIGLLFVFRSIVRYVHSHASLEKLEGRFPTGELPPAGTLWEEDYQKIIAALEAERVSLSNEMEARQKDSEEYYTLWIHQIKTPIAAMRLLLQQETGEGLPSANILEQELFRIEQYTDMALQYQRLNSMHSDLLFKEHDIEKLVYSALKSSAPLFIGKGISAKPMQISGKVITDAKWFCFVLEQLFSNAVKYTPKQGSVTIYTENSRLIIEDNGVGIAAEDLPRVFERGYTGYAGRQNARATGVGLYLCKEIMNRLGFNIQIESCLGKGTKVILNLKQQSLVME